MFLHSIVISILLIFFTANVYSCATGECPTESTPCFSYENFCEGSTDLVSNLNSIKTNIDLIIKDKYQVEKEILDRQGIIFYPSDKEQNEAYLSFYIEVINSTELNTEDKSLFIEWRKKFIEDENSSLLNFKNENHPFKKFSNGIFYFHKLDFKQAKDNFKEAYENADDGPLKDSALYLCMRSSIKYAERSFDGYDRNQIDKNEIENIHLLRDEYLKKFPSGKFVQSVFDLGRWLLVLEQKYAEHQSMLDKKILDLDLKKMLTKDENDLRAQNIANLMYEYSSHSIDFTQPSPYYFPMYVVNSFANVSANFNKDNEKKFKKIIDEFKKISDFEKNYGYEYLLSKTLYYYCLKDYKNIILTLENKDLNKSELLKKYLAIAYIYEHQLKKALKISYEINNQELIILAYVVNGKAIELLDEPKIVINSENINYYVNILIKALDVSTLKKYIYSKKIKNKKLLSSLESEFVRKVIVEGKFDLLKSVNTISKGNNSIVLTINKYLLDKNPKYLFEASKYLGKSDFLIFDYRTCLNGIEQEYDRHKLNFHLPIDYMMKIEKSLDKNKQYDFEADLLSMLIKCFRQSSENNCFMGELVDYEKEAPHSLRKLWFKKLKTKYKTSKYAADLSYYY